MATQVSDSPAITSTSHRGGDAPPGESNGGISLDVNSDLPPDRAMESHSTVGALDGISSDVSMAVPHDCVSGDRSNAEALDDISLDTNSALPPVSTMGACSSTEPMGGISLEMYRNADTAHDKVSIKCRGRYRIRVKGTACHGHACCGGTCVIHSPLWLP